MLPTSALNTNVGIPIWFFSKYFYILRNCLLSVHVNAHLLKDFYLILRNETSNNTDFGFSVCADLISDTEMSTQVDRVKTHSACTQFKYSFLIF